MKRIKLSLALVAAVAAIGVAALTTERSSAKGAFVDVWYQYTGPQTEAGFRTEANYVKYAPQPADVKVVCPSAQTLCAVRVPDNGTQPAAFSSSFETAIISAVNTNIETSQIELKP